MTPNLWAMFMPNPSASQSGLDSIGEKDDLYFHENISTEDGYGDGDKNDLINMSSVTDQFSRQSPKRPLSEADNGVSIATDD